MLTETQDGLTTSKAFLRDCVELTHLMLRQKLEAMRRGEQIDWDETREIAKEGRTAARQLAQIASLEVRDRSLDLREKTTKKPEPTHAPDVHHSERNIDVDRRVYMESKLEWMTAYYESAGADEPPMPAKLTELMHHYGVTKTGFDGMDQLSGILLPDDED